LTLPLFWKHRAGLPLAAVVTRTPALGKPPPSSPGMCSSGAARIATPAGPS